MATVELPDHAQKRIYKASRRACILVGYCPDTLAYFDALFIEAKKSFPWLKAENATCGKVTNSHSVQGFTLLTFLLPDDAPLDVEGWSIREGHIDFHY